MRPEREAQVTSHANAACDDRLRPRVDAAGLDAPTAASACAHARTVRHRLCLIPTQLGARDARRRYAPRDGRRNAGTEHGTGSGHGGQ